MRLPRPQFTIRRLMIAVAVAAILSAAYARIEREVRRTLPGNRGRRRPR